jgi:hypothetical protein
MSTTVVLRPARHDEDRVLRRLADLDSAAPLTGEVVLAVDGDRAVAAMSVTDGRVVADPFTRTADTVELLREYVAGLRDGRMSLAERLGRTRRKRTARRDRRSGRGRARLAY